MEKSEIICSFAADKPNFYIMKVEQITMVNGYATAYIVTNGKQVRAYQAYSCKAYERVIDAIAALEAAGYRVLTPYSIGYSYGD